MTAEELYAALDRAGLTPPCHYCAAPHEWREAPERIEVELSDEVFTLNDEIEDLEGERDHFKDRNKALVTELCEAKTEINRLLSQLVLKETAAQ